MKIVRRISAAQSAGMPQMGVQFATKGLVFILADPKKMSLHGSIIFGKATTACSGAWVVQLLI